MSQDKGAPARAGEGRAKTVIDGETCDVQMRRAAPSGAVLVLGRPVKPGGFLTLTFESNGDTVLLVCRVRRDGAGPDAPASTGPHEVSWMQARTAAGEGVLQRFLATTLGLPDDEVAQCHTSQGESYFRFRRAGARPAPSSQAALTDSEESLPPTATILDSGLDEDEPGAITVPDTPAATAHDDTPRAAAPAEREAAAGAGPGAADDAPLPPAHKVVPFPQVDGNPSEGAVTIRSPSVHAAERQAPLVIYDETLLEVDVGDVLRTSRPNA